MIRANEEKPFFRKNGSGEWTIYLLQQNTESVSMCFAYESVGTSMSAAALKSSRQSVDSVWSVEKNEFTSRSCH